MGALMEQAPQGDFKDNCSLCKHAQTRTEGKKQVMCQGKDGVKVGAVHPGFGKGWKIKFKVFNSVEN